jgi:hypothetical protein
VFLALKPHSYVEDMKEYLFEDFEIDVSETTIRDTLKRERTSLNKVQFRYYVIPIIASTIDRFKGLSENIGNLLIRRNIIDRVQMVLSGLTNKVKANCDCLERWYCTRFRMINKAV